MLVQQGTPLRIKRSELCQNNNTLLVEAVVVTSRFLEMEIRTSYSVTVGATLQPFQREHADDAAQKQNPKKWTRGKCG